jgi:hypothetical protein
MNDCFVTLGLRRKTHDHTVHRAQIIRFEKVVHEYDHVIHEWTETIPSTRSSCVTSEQPEFSLWLVGWLIDWLVHDVGWLVQLGCVEELEVIVGKY